MTDNRTVPAPPAGVKPPIDLLDHANAVELRRRISRELEMLDRQLAEAQATGAHTALGYPTWEAYIEAEVALAAPFLELR